MIFTKEDLQRIAKNMKTIRLAYGYKTQLDFAFALDPNGRYPGLSHDMIKKYESGKYQISEQTVRLFASLSMCPFESIVFDDIDYLEPNSLVLKQDKTVGLDKESLDDYSAYISNVFPLFESDKLMKIDSFAKAMGSCRDGSSIWHMTGEDLEETINAFFNANCPEAYLNVLSLLGRIYVTYIYEAINPKSAIELTTKQFSNWFEFAKEVHKKTGYDEDYREELKRVFLKTYNTKLTICMKKVAEDERYKDYVYYYLGLRYYFGIMDNKITRLSDDEMNCFGINMLDCLKIIGNRYAIEFKKCN